MKAREILALVVAMTGPTILSLLVFFVFASPEQRSNPWLQGVFSVGKVLQFLFPLLYVALFDRAALRMQKPTWRGMRRGIVFAVLTALLTFGLYFLWLRDTRLIAKATERVHQLLTQFDLPSPAGFLVMAFFICVIHSLMEEYYWRWFVFGRLRSFMAWQTAAVVSGLAFMSHHVVLLGFYLPGYFWVGVVPFSLCIAVGGTVWAWIYQRTGSLLATWVSHCLIDMAIMVVGYDLLMRAIG